MRRFRCNSLLLDKLTATDISLQYWNLEIDM
jgi:hypothetical protein